MSKDDSGKSNGSGEKDPFVVDDLMRYVSNFVGARGVSNFSAVNKRVRGSLERSRERNDASRELDSKTFFQNVQDLVQIEQALENSYSEEERKGLIDDKIGIVNNISQLLIAGNVDFRGQPIASILKIAAKNVDIAKAMIQGDFPLKKLVKNNGSLLRSIACYGGEGSAIMIRNIVSGDSEIDINKRDDFENRTPLHWAAIGESRFPCLQALIECGADKNLKDSLGHSAVYLAAVNGNYEGAKFLLEAGAVIEKKDIQVACGAKMVSLLNEHLNKQILSRRGEDGDEEKSVEPQVKDLFKTAYRTRRPVKEEVDSRSRFAVAEGKLGYEEKEHKDKDVEHKSNEVILGVSSDSSSVAVAVARPLKTSRAKPASRLDKVHIAEETADYEKAVESKQEDTKARPSGALRAMRDFISGKRWEKIDPSNENSGERKK